MRDEIVEVESAEAGSSIVITKQPESVKAEVGETVTFTVEATGATGWQWQYSKDQENWYNTGLSGSRTATISVPVIESRYGFYWRCVLTGTDGTTLASSGALLSKPVTEITVDDVIYSILGESNSVTVKKYVGNAQTVVIPEIVEGYSVIQIGPSAFEGNTSLRSIDLPDSIVIIGKRAFAGCTNLCEMK